MPSAELPAFLADLHLHTVLSPCADVEMIPPLIVERALDLHLGLITVTDHNATGNCAAVMAAAAGTDLAVLPGVEVQTVEEVHLLCLFDSMVQVSLWQRVISQHLPDLENRPEFFGEQYIVNQNGDYLGAEVRLLMTSIDLSLDDVVLEVDRLGGITIPAHIDRPTSSLLANLGFVPVGLTSPALELHRTTSREAFLAVHPDLSDRTLIRGSDAHRLAEMMPSLCLRMERRCVAELQLALLGRAGRSSEWHAAI